MKMTTFLSKTCHLGMIDDGAKGHVKILVVI